MITFKSFLNKLLENQNLKPTSHDEMVRLLNLDKKDVKRDKNHPNHEQRLNRAIDSLNSAEHGEDFVRQYLERHSQPDASRIARKAVAQHKELHNFPEIHARMLKDPAEMIRTEADKPRKGTKKRGKAAETTEQTPKAEMKPVSPPKPKKSAEEKPKKDSAKPGSYTIKKGDPSSIPYAEEVTHVVDHKNRIVGSAVKHRYPSELGSKHDVIKHTAYVGDITGRGAQVLSHHGDHIEAVKALGAHLKNN